MYSFLLNIEYVEGNVKFEEFVLETENFSTTLLAVGTTSDL